MRSPTFTAVIVAMLFAGVANAQKPNTYPTKGQTAQQPTADDTECLWSPLK